MHGEVTVKEKEGLLTFAMEGRKRIKDQLLRIDTTYAPVRFGYQALTDEKGVFVKTLATREKYTLIIN